jgi:hypothetical protein
MNYQPSDYPYPSEDYEASVLDGEMILFSSKTEKALYLNAPSKMILELCNGELSVTEIINLLLEAYPEASDELEADVNVTFENLYEGGAILFSHSPVNITA